MKTTRTVILARKMDCAAEETMVRERLSGVRGLHSLTFDIPNRSLTVHHSGDAAVVLDRINQLSLDARIVSSEEIETEAVELGGEEAHRTTLFTLLAVNGAMFVVEVFSGLVFDSMGLLGDGLDMLADASVYSLALFAVGRAAAVKNRITLYSGLAQLVLALLLAAEVARKFFSGSDPLSLAMIAVSSLALAANVYCLYLITPHRHGEKYMTASWIFSANDVAINAGVILAGILVFLTRSPLPDLVIGSVITVIVIIGATRIIRLSRS